MSEPKLVSTWEELTGCKSDTHVLVIDLDGGSGWVRPKDKSIQHEEHYKNDCYLSTHTFYGSSYQRSTKILQECGFHIQLKSWG